MYKTCDLSSPRIMVKTLVILNHAIAPK